MDRIKLIETFLAVTEAGSFTAGAERLGISAALASKYVGHLEQQLGVRLLNRTTRSNSLTEIGKIYLEGSSQIVEDFVALDEAIRGRKGQVSGRLVISAPLTFGEMHITRLISEFLAEYPDVETDLKLTDRFVELADEGIDLAIRIAELPDADLIARRLAPARVVVAASPEYLAKNGKPVHPKDLKQHECIIDTNFRSKNEWRFLDSGQPLTVTISGRFHVNSARATREMILQGGGIGLIPTYAIGDEILAGNAVPLLQRFESLNLGIYAVYLPNRYLAAKTRAFIDFMVSKFGASPEWDRF